MEDRRPLLLFTPDQDIIRSTFDGDDTVLPMLAAFFDEEPSQEGEDFAALYSRMLTQLRGQYGTGLPIVGCLPARYLEMEPHGEDTFLEAVQHYADRAEAAAAAGCDLLMLRSVPTLVEARAAVLGMRTTGLPLWVTVDLDREGEELEEGADVLATFLALQGMGIGAFGFGRPDSGDRMIPQLERIAPHARIPLIARPECLAEDGETVLTPGEFGQMAEEFCRLGVRICGAGYGATAGHLLAAKTVLEQCGANDVPPADEDEILLCTETQVFYLDDNLELSPPLDCGVDMTEELLEAEESGCDVVCVRLETADDGYRFFLNSYLLGLPVCFLADDKESLEAGLFFYPGRAMVDSRSTLERDLLEEVAARYGAIVI